MPGLSFLFILPYSKVLFTVDYHVIEYTLIDSIPEGSIPKILLPSHAILPPVLLTKKTLK